MEFFIIADAIESVFVAAGDAYKRYLWSYILVALCIYAVLYTFEAVALYTIAKREGYKNRWMAFVPFANTYYIGVVAEKNKVFSAKTKYVSLAAALLEAAYAVLGILYLVATYIIFNGGYAAPQYSTSVTVSGTIEVLSGYNPVNLPASLNWAWWIADNMQGMVMYWVELVQVILSIFVLIAFFRTYSSPRYVLFSIFSVLLPIKGIFMFAVRNNRGKNYGEYLREQRQRQYNAYQEYMRNGGQNQGGYYGGGYNNPNYNQQGNPYSQQPRQNPPEDPFDGLGGSGNGGGSQSNGGSGGNGGDPFDDFN